MYSRASWIFNDRVTNYTILVLLVLKITFSSTIFAAEWSNEISFNFRFILCSFVFLQLYEAKNQALVSHITFLVNLVCKGMQKLFAQLTFTKLHSCNHYYEGLIFLREVCILKTCWICFTLVHNSIFITEWNVDICPI